MDNPRLKERRKYGKEKAYCCCPHCNSKLTTKKDLDEEEDADEDLESAYLQKFRMSADFISRIMAPSVLDQLATGESKDKEKFVLHDGQQYISFADSRQLAAKATLKQNLEQERMWFYSTIYHEMCRRKANQPVIEEKINDETVEETNSEVLYNKVQNCLDSIHDLEQIIKNKFYGGYRGAGQIQAQNSRS